MARTSWMGRAVLALACGWGGSVWAQTAGPGLELSESPAFFDWESAGVRGGMGTNDKSEKFMQAEAYSHWALPWAWTWAEQWHLSTHAEASGGVMSDYGKEGFVGAFGPYVTVRWGDFPVFFEGGSSFTLISEHEFEEADFGSTVQFTSHAGLRWQVHEHWSLGYRYQHMSNAGLDSRNPGLDLHVVSVGYRF